MRHTALRLAFAAPVALMALAAACHHPEGDGAELIPPAPPGAGQSASVSVDAEATAAEAPEDTPGAAPQENASSGPASLVVAGGCFWCTEVVFEGVKGVTDVVSGYSGGTPDTANYSDVSKGNSTHAEAIRITYDPSQVSEEQLLTVFFEVAHDPTQLDRQGPDWGKQYRSSAFFEDEAQKARFQAHIDALDKKGKYAEPIVTRLEPLDAFYPAEDYHQDFVRRNPTHGYVVQNALPKVRKLRERFGSWVVELE